VPLVFFFGFTDEWSPLLATGEGLELNFYEEALGQCDFLHGRFTHHSHTLRNVNITLMRVQTILTIVLMSVNKKLNNNLRH
jgi:hypothetical protein